MIALQGNIAKAAAKQTASELLVSLGRLLDPVALTCRHPLAGTASAAAVGLVVSVGVFPGSEKEPKNESAAPAQGSHLSHPDNPSGLLSFILTAGLGLLRSALVPVIQNAIQSRFKNPASGSSHRKVFTSNRE